LGTPLYGVSRTNVYSDGVERGLGFSKGYLTSAIARNNGFVSNLPDFKSIAANPRFLRLFSSESPKKKSKLGFHCCYALMLMCASVSVLISIYCFWQIMKTFIPRKRKKFQREKRKKMSLKVIKLNNGVVPCFIVEWETVTVNYLRIVAVADVMTDEYYVISWRFLLS
jgi:hypothetical protein